MQTTEPETTRTEPKTTCTVQEIAELEHKTTAQLRARYRELFDELPSCHNKQRLIRRIAWRLQSLAEGDLSERARRRAAYLARDADVRLLPPRTWQVPGVAFRRAVDDRRDRRLPAAGTVLRREFRGRQIEVEVLEAGFRCNGAVHPSLSAVARHVTGTQWNGFVFFGLHDAVPGKA